MDLKKESAMADDKADEERKQLELFYGLTGLEPEEIRKEQQRQLEKRNKDWKENGLCPKCGVKGYFSNFAFVCPEHGPY